MTETGTYEYRIKCQNCGLHYAVFSWDEEWAGGPSEGRQGGYCPECGVGGSKMVWGPVERPEPIFHFIPGEIAGGTRIVDGKSEIVEATAPLQMTGPLAESAFGIPKHMTEPR